MKLCFLAGANSIHSYRWIKYLADKGYEIHWISLAPMTDCGGKIKNLKLYLTPYLIEKWQFGPSSLLKLLFNVIWAGRLINKIKPDILHSHYAGVNGLAGALSGFHPFILTAWGSDILIAPKSKIVKPLIKFVLKKADLITCDAEHMKKSMVDLGASPSKIKIIYFGTDAQKFSPGPRDEELIKELKIQDSPVIISLRSFEPIYDIETLIRAIPIILKELPEAKFIIAGKGSEEEKLKNLAKDLNILESIRFPGFISNADLPRYLKTSDIYVSTSLSDAGLSSSTAEAMASGLPVIITDIGENEKWVKGGESGYLIPVKNSNILAEKIVYLIKNENLRKELGLTNRKKIEDEKNFYREMEKMEKLYYSSLIPG